MTRIETLRRKYEGLQGDMPPFGDVIYLLALVSSAQRALTACKMRLANNGIPEPPEVAEFENSR